MRFLDTLFVIVYLLLFWPMVIFSCRLRNLRTPLDMVLAWAVGTLLLNGLWLIAVMITFGEVMGWN